MNLRFALHVALFSGGTTRRAELVSPHQFDDKLAMVEFALRAAHSLLIPGSPTYPWLGSMDGFGSCYTTEKKFPVFRFVPSYQDLEYARWLDSKPQPLVEVDGAAGSYKPIESGEENGFPREP